MTKDLQIVDNCDPGSEHFSKGFKPQMLAPSEEVASKLHLERWYGYNVCVRFEVINAA